MWSNAVATREDFTGLSCWLLSVTAISSACSCCLLSSNYKRLSSGVFAACRQIDEDSMGRGAAKLFNRNLVATVCEHGTTSTKRPFTKILFTKHPLPNVLSHQATYKTSSLLYVHISKRPGYRMYFYKSSFLLHVFIDKL
jgi:hypothetical protein